MSANFTACGCVGPQNGEPLCPCAMRNVTVRDGRYIQKEKDLGPVSTRSKPDMKDVYKRLDETLKDIFK